MFLAVSMNVSPFDRLLLEAVKSTTSAPSRLAARPKLVRVRVEFSKNRFEDVLPSKQGQLPAAAVGRLLEGKRRVENRRQLFQRQALQVQEIATSPRVRVSHELGGSLLIAPFLLRRVSVLRARRGRRAGT